MEECRKHIFMLDSKGLVCKSRLHELQHHKLKFAHDVGEIMSTCSARSSRAVRILPFGDVHAMVARHVCFAYDSGKY